MTESTTARTLISQGSPFEEKMGYSRAVKQGPWVFVSGTTGFDYSTMTISDDVAEQAEQAFKNIAWALEQAGASLADTVRVRYLITDKAFFEPVLPVLGKYFGDVRPAATVEVVGLIDAEMKIEIEVTAVTAE